MYKTLFDNNIFIISLFFITALVSTIFSIYFLSVMFAGVLFLGFKRCLDTKSYYSLSFIIASFLFIELNNGFKPFSLVLLSAFIYIFVLPYLTRVLSFNNLNSYVYIAVFYLGVFLLWSISYQLSWHLFFTIIANIFIDLFIFGFFI